MQGPENDDTETATEKLRKAAASQASRGLRDDLLDWLRSGVASRDLAKVFDNVVRQAVGEIVSEEMKSERTRAAVADGVEAAFREAVSGLWPADRVSALIRESIDASWREAVREAVDRHVEAFFARDDVRNYILGSIRENLGSAIAWVISQKSAEIAAAAGKATARAMAEADLTGAVAGAPAGASGGRPAVRGAGAELPANEERENAPPFISEDSPPPRPPDQPPQEVTEESLEALWRETMPFTVTLRWPSFAAFEKDLADENDPTLKSIGTWARWGLATALAAAARELKGDLAENLGGAKGEERDRLERWSVPAWYLFYKNRFVAIHEALSGYRGLYPDSAALKDVNMGAHGREGLKVSKVVAAIREMLARRGLPAGADAAPEPASPNSGPPAQTPARPNPKPAKPPAAGGKKGGP